MTYTRRVLPRAEWPRLAGTELETIWPALSSATTTIEVVENEHGEIRGCWAKMTVEHAEGVWVHPEDRKRGRVQRLLMEGMREMVHADGATGVMTGADDPAVAALLERHGATRINAVSYILPFPNAQTARDQRRGEHFHAGLVACHVEPNHPANPVHDQAVGRALRIALEEGEPERAEATYNAWARLSGYETVQFLRGDADGLRVDIRSALILIGADDALTVVARPEAVGA